MIGRVSWAEWSARRQRRISAQRKVWAEKRSVRERLEAERSALARVPNPLKRLHRKALIRFETRGRSCDPYLIGVLAGWCGIEDAVCRHSPAVLNGESRAQYLHVHADSNFYHLADIADELKALRDRYPSEFDKAICAKYGPGSGRIIIEELQVHGHRKTHAHDEFRRLARILLADPSGRKPARKIQEVYNQA